MPITSVPLVGAWVNFTLPGLAMLFLIGFVGMLYQMMMTRAYRHAKAFKVGSVLYSAVIFAAIFDWFLEGKFLDYISIIGVILIIVGSLTTLRATREKNET